MLPGLRLNRGEIDIQSPVDEGLMDIVNVLGPKPVRVLQIEWMISQKCWESSLTNGHAATCVIVDLARAHRDPVINMVREMIDGADHDLRIPVHV